MDMKGNPLLKSRHGILVKFGYLLGAHGVRELFQAAFLIYLARLSSANYGEVMLALGIGSILLFGSEFGLSQPMVLAMSRRDENPGEVISRVLALKAVLLMSGSAGVGLFAYMQGYDNDLFRIVLIIAFGVGLESVARTFFVVLQVKGKQEIESTVKVLAAVIGFGFGLVALLMGLPTVTIAWFKTVESAVLLLLGARVVIKGYGMRFSLPVPRYLYQTARTGLIFALMDITTITYNKANLFFLQRKAGSDGVAQYSATWQIVEGVGLLASMLLLRRILFPLFVQLRKTDRAAIPRLAGDTAAWLLLAALPLMFVLGVESDRIIHLVYGPHYKDAAYLQTFLVAAIPCMFIHNLCADLMVSMGKQRLLLVIYLAGLAVNLPLCLFLISKNALIGSALAIVLTKLGVAIATTSYCRFRPGLPAGGKLIHIGVACIAGAGMYLTCSNLTPREYSEAAALLPFLFTAWRWSRLTRNHAAHS